MNYKYTVIISELFNKVNTAIIYTEQNYGEYVENFRSLITDLEKMKSGGNGEISLGDFDEEYITKEIRYRYNVNGNGDIYVVNFEDINSCLNFILLEAKNEIELTKRFPPSDEIIRIREERNNTDKFNEIVKKYFVFP
ncbi:MAG: hypothetical protein ACRC0G_04130 [Fusobacteriaceae bacterium]